MVEAGLVAHVHAWVHRVLRVDPLVRLDGPSTIVAVLTVPFFCLLASTLLVHHEEFKF